MKLLLHRLCMILPAADIDDDPPSYAAKTTASLYSRVAAFGGNLVLRSKRLFYCCHKDNDNDIPRKQQLSDIAFHNAEGVYLSDNHHHQQRTFSYAELYIGTNGFSHDQLLGSGGFGKVYKAVLPGDDTQVAVKCLAEKGDRFEKSFVAELMAVSNLRHKNLVSLRGWCVHDENQLLLVYDYMPNRSLDRLLFPQPTIGYSSPLSWDRRVRIVKGLAAALYYLHEQLETQIIHRDVKSSNVMLDSNFNAKLGDFGLARWLDHKLDEDDEEEDDDDMRTPSSKYSMKLNHQYFKLAETTRIGGTIGYLPPESFKRRKDGSITTTITAKSDVYSFGIVVLEVVSRRRAVDLTYSLEDEIILVDWVRKLSDENRLFEAGGGGGDSLASSSEMERLIHIGLLCTLDEPQLRPNMKWVVQALAGTICGKLPPLPSFQSHPLYISLSSDDNNSTNTKTFTSTTIYYSSPKYIKHNVEATVYVTAESGDTYRSTNLSMVETAREISFQEIIDATHSFSDSKRVAELDFGSAYHGVLDSSGQHVLIKRLGMKTCPALRMRFCNEVKNLGRLRHRNLVQLRGWCSEQGEMLVVYDYLKNRLLSHVLSFHNINDHRRPRVLLWHHRYNIVKSLASAILYLHEEWDQQVIHQNITSSAVILDPDMNPRLTSFALAEFLARNEHGNAKDEISSPATTPRGIFGYMSPEYIESGIATTMADVYSFGVVVLEVVTGRMAVDFRTPEVLLVKRVHELEARKKALEGVADPGLTMCNLKEVVRLMKVGVACISSDPEQRPSMRQITSILDGNDQCFMEQGRKKEKDHEWKRRNAYSLSMIKRIQAIGIQ